MTFDAAAVITALSAGIAGVLGAIAGLRRAKRSVGSEVAEAVSRNAGMFSEALAGMEGELARPRAACAQSRKSSLTLAAMALPFGTRSPS